MDGKNFVASADTMLKNVVEYTTYFVPRQLAAPPTAAFDYNRDLRFDGQRPTIYANPQNCYLLPPGALSYPPFVKNFAPSLPSQKYKNDDQQSSQFYYSVTKDNVDGHQRRKQSKPVNGMRSRQRRHQRKPKVDEPNKINSSQPDGDCDYGNVQANQNVEMVDGLAKLKDEMHPVQLLHQIFRNEAFIMEYERINDGPFSRVQVTYKVNGRSYVSEASRLKEARRLCAKKILRDLFPQFRVDADDNVPKPEYDSKRFANKHPVQILFQVFRREPIEMHCEEEGAAHFAKHIFTFIVNGKKYRAKAETIKEAKRRAAILVLNDYFKKDGDGFDCQGEGDANFGHES